MTGLEKNLYTRHPLKFGEDGKFRIFMMSDFQEVVDAIDPRTLPAIEAMLDKVKPDLVVLGGDNCQGKIQKGLSDLERYIEIMTAPMEKRKIPWCHVYGNHDHDMDVPVERQQKVYESREYCVSKHTGKGVSGTSNFVLPIIGRDGKPKFCVWGLDSHNRWETFCRDVGLPEKTPFRYENFPEQYRKWDVIRFDQQMWYWKSSCELEKYAGRKVDGMLVTHVELHEFQLAKENPVELKLSGSTDERLSLGGLNSGLFSTLLQRGDIKIVACGHSHKVDFVAEHLGITMCLDACAGFSPSGVDELRGGRVFDLTETDVGADFSTYMVRACELI